MNINEHSTCIACVFLHARKPDENGLHIDSVYNLYPSVNTKQYKLYPFYMRSHRIHVDRYNLYRLLSVYTYPVWTLLNSPKECAVTGSRYSSHHKDREL